MISLDLVAELSALASAILVGSFKTVSIHSVGPFHASYQKPFLFFICSKKLAFIHSLKMDMHVQGGGGNQQSVIPGGPMLQSNSLPFYIPLLTNGTSFTYLV